MNLWLERFVFCGTTVGPTANLQHIAQALVEGKTMPLGQYLLGATYHLLHQALAKLLVGKPIGHTGGPWWFVQLWLNLYTVKAADRPALEESLFPGDYAEDADETFRRCMSLGEAALVYLGAGPSVDNFKTWFYHFYDGFPRNARIWYPYEDVKADELPADFRPDIINSDSRSREVFVSALSPCILPTGFFTGCHCHARKFPNRIPSHSHVSYEFYHPMVAARQLGCGQVSIGLYFANKIQTRGSISSALIFNRLT